MVQPLVLPEGLARVVPHPVLQGPLVGGVVRVPGPRHAVPGTVDLAAVAVLHPAALNTALVGLDRA